MKREAQEFIDCDLLQTARLRLFPLSLAHLQAWLRGRGEIVMRLGVPIAPGTASQASLRAMAVKVKKMQNVAPSAHSWYTYWLIQLQAPAIGIGLIGFKGAPDGRCEAEIGYSMAPAYRRRGYMSEAVQAMMAWAWAQPGCDAIRAVTAQDNLPSQRVLQKTGWVIDEVRDEVFVWRVWRPALRSSA